MKDFGLDILFFAGTTIGAAVIVFFLLRFRLLRFCKMAAKESLEHFKTKDLPFYYSSYAVKQECIRKFFRLSLPENARLARCDIAEALKILGSEGEKPSFQTKLLQAQLLSLVPACRTQFIELMAMLELPYWVSKPDKAAYYYLKAQYEVYLTDMQAAVAHLTRAHTLYRRLGFVYEQAECYLLFAQIYRIVGVFDVAETMLKEAEKLFDTLDIKAKNAEVTAVYGLIAIGREQYDGAAAYLAKAVALAKRYRLVNVAANICNWLGLAYYLQSKDADAEKSFKYAYKNAVTSECKTLAAEMLSRLCHRRGEYKKALRYVDVALQTDNNPLNRDGRFENEYLKAEILYAENQYTQSTKILIQIIKSKLAPKSTFYKANAYTLLGVIKLKQNELELAKTLFKQAADLEHGKNRLKGAAVDFNNLAEIAFREGNNDVAEMYLKQAVTYAEQVGEKELAASLKAKLK